MAYLMLLTPFSLLIIFNLFSRRTRGFVSFWLTLLALLFQVGVALVTTFKIWPGILDLKLESLFGFDLLLNPLAALLILCSGLAGLAALLVERATTSDEEDRFNFKNLLMIATIGINGIALVTDIFSLYVFIEVTTLATFILMANFKSTAAREAIFKYLVMSVVASTLMLSAIALFLMAAHGTYYGEIKEAMGLVSRSPIPQIAVGLFICGLFIKGGLVPFHGWLPDVYMAAPSPVSVYLGGIVTKAVGIFPLIILSTRVFGISSQLHHVLMFVGAISIVIGALAALGQSDMKRMLAYSSISQMGYIVLALGTGTKIGVIAAIFHFFNHAVFKTQLFANAAAVEAEAGLNMDKLGGLAAKMPVTGTTTLIAMLSTAGVPPLAGFWSKLLIVIALWTSGDYLYTYIAVLASVITLAYFLSMNRRVFFGRLADGLEKVKEARLANLVPAVFLSLVIVVVGLITPLIFNYLVK